MEKVIVLIDFGNVDDKCKNQVVEAISESTFEALDFDYSNSSSNEKTITLSFKSTSGEQLNKQTYEYLAEYNSLVELISPIINKYGVDYVMDIEKE